MHVCSHVWVLAVTTAALYGGIAEAQPQRRILSMKTADRAIDLAWQAELAGDFKGARAGLDELVQTSTLSMEAPARARIEEWKESMAVRQKAFEAHGRTARGYHDALASLERFGLDRSADLLARAKKDLPSLAAVSSESKAARILVEAIRGPVKKAEVERTLSDFLARHGSTVETRAHARAAYEVRVDVDATEAESSSRSAKVTAKTTVVVRAIDARGKARPVGNISKRRTERRRTEAEARSFAVRRALDDAGSSLVHLIQLGMLAELASRETGASGRN